jgi:hypothetical protein
MSLQASIVRQSRLSPADRESMLELHARYFSNVRRERFLADLAEKDWVIRLSHFERIVGFSTQRLMTLRHDGRDRHVLFSGDTIVDRAFWREHELAGAFGHLILRLMAEHGEDGLYWFLISKGYRTYRFLPVFFNRFWPNPLSPADAGRPALLPVVARARYGAAYDEARGVIVAAEDSDRLRPEMCDVPPSRRRDAYVDFFLDRNPGFARGDELACLAELRRDNLNDHAWRVIERTIPVWVE